jgi:signal transduction histidine kinase
MSIRLRLTLLYTAIVALTLLALSAGVYAFTARVTLEAAERALVAEAQQLAERPVFEPNRIDDPKHPFGSAPIYMQFRTPDGTVAAKTSNLAEEVLPLSAAGLQASQQRREWIETTSLTGGRLLVYSRPLIYHGRFVAIVQVARSLAEVDELLAALARSLVVGGLGVTGLAFGIGWLLAGTALRPIDHITATAQTIGAERDFSRRVEYRGPRDEVGALAATFNTMLTELESAYRQLEASLQAQRRFVADASHELRTPLTTIRGNLGLLQRQPAIEPGDRQAAVGDMVAETERLMRLVNDLLVLARADARRPLLRAPVPLAPLVEDACRQASLVAPEHTIECRAPAETIVAGDRDALKQVLLILLDNAIKYTPEQTPVTVAVEPAGERVLIRVTDRGPGIPLEVLPHIFERFYRADTARSPGGAGLGLAIARVLVEAQGGTIAIASGEQGSTFTLDLPAAAAPPAPPAS